MYKCMVFQLPIWRDGCPENVIRSVALQELIGIKKVTSALKAIWILWKVLLPKLMSQTILLLCEPPKKLTDYFWGIKWQCSQELLEKLLFSIVRNHFIHICLSIWKVLCYLLFLSWEQIWGFLLNIWLNETSWIIVVEKWDGGLSFNSLWIEWDHQMWKAIAPFFVYTVVMDSRRGDTESFEQNTYALPYYKGKSLKPIVSSDWNTCF